MNLVTKIVGILVSGLQSMIQGIANGITTGVTALFVDGEGNLTNFAEVTISFGAVALGMALCYWVVSFIRSKIG